MYIYVLFFFLSNDEWNASSSTPLRHQRSDVKWLMRWRVHCHWFWLKFFVLLFPLPLFSPRLRGYFNPSARRLPAAAMPQVLTTALKREVETSFCDLSLNVILKLVRKTDSEPSPTTRGRYAAKWARNVPKFVFIYLFYISPGSLNLLTIRYGHYAIINILCNSFLQFSAWGCVRLACASVS